TTQPDGRPIPRDAVCNKPIAGTERRGNLLAGYPVLLSPCNEHFHGAPAVLESSADFQLLAVRAIASQQRVLARIAEVEKTPNEQASRVLPDAGAPVTKPGRLVLDQGGISYIHKVEAGADLPLGIVAVSDLDEYVFA